MTGKRVRIDMIGKTFGHLTCIGFSHVDTKKTAHWVFRCSCGTVKSSSGSDVRAGKIISCGHLKKAAIIKQTHGHAKRGKKTPTYISWRNAVSRCHDPKHPAFADYGGRGIVVCDRWRQSYEHFFADMGERPAGTTIDRIDVNGHYEPGNCRWATFIEQCNNRRTSRVVTFRGQSMTMAQLAKAFGIPIGTMWYRLENGWTVEDAATIEVKVGRNQFTPRDF